MLRKRLAHANVCAEDDPVVVPFEELPVVVPPAGYVVHELDPEGQVKVGVGVRVKELDCPRARIKKCILTSIKIGS